VDPGQVTRPIIATSDGTKATLIEFKASLIESKVTLNDTKLSLDDTKETLNDLKQSLNDTKLSSNDLKQSLDDTKLSLNDLKETLNGTKLGVDASMLRPGRACPAQGLPTRRQDAPNHGAMPTHSAKPAATLSGNPCAKDPNSRCASASIPHAAQAVRFGREGRRARGGRTGCPERHPVARVRCRQRATGWAQAHPVIRRT
jgi:hypothetical protein